MNVFCNLDFTHYLETSLLDFYFNEIILIYDELNLILIIISLLCFINNLGYIHGMKSERNNLNSIHIPSIHHKLKPLVLNILYIFTCN